LMPHSPKAPTPHSFLAAQQALTAHTACPASELTAALLFAAVRSQPLVRTVAAQRVLLLDLRYLLSTLHLLQTTGGPTGPCWV
jgi:hypothetical protein